MEKESERRYEMDYRAFAMDELRNFEQNRTAERIIKSRIIELEEKKNSISGGTSPNRGGGNKTEQRWLNLISSIGDEKERLREVMRKIKRVEAALAAIPENEAEILQKLYVVGYSIENLSKAEHLSERTAYRARANALISFTRALYGAVVT